MAFKAWQLGLVSFTFGLVSFILAVVAENKKPEAGIPFGKDVVICKFPSDPTVPLGFLSIVSLLISSVIGAYSLFYSYQGISVPKGELFKYTPLHVFFWLAIVLTTLGGAGLLWATLTELLHRTHNVHHKVGYTCPTAKTGLFGGAAFIALDAALFWGICLMLTGNSREDHLNEEPKGGYGAVPSTAPATNFEGKLPTI